MSASSPRSSRAGTRHISPLADFLRTEAAGGVLLVGAAIAALLWANIWPGSYGSFWHTEASLSVGDWSLAFDLQHWVNEALMTVFFLVVGLEIKRELTEGELNEPRRAAFPFVAAVGGMAVPAALYAIINGGAPSSNGWAIPMATDIAMALGVLALLGPRIPSALKLFLLALAIVDDIGSVIVIALFYGKGVKGQWGIIAMVLIAAMVIAKRLNVRRVGPYMLIGTAMWYCTYRAGIHPTLVGVLCGLLAPTKPFLNPGLVDATALADVSSYDAANETVRLAHQSVSVVEWLEHKLVPWSSYLVVPLCALANAGIPVSRQAFGDAVTGRLGLGIIVGLVAGKALGITLFSWLGVKANLATLPDGVQWKHVFGVASLAGIGFTVSLFIAGLSFDDPTLQDQARLAILLATVAAGLIGSLVLLAATRGEMRSDPTPGQ